MSAPTQEPVDVDLEAAAVRWLEEIASAHETSAARWLTMVVAAERDFGELIRQLPPGALAGAPARAAGEAVESLLANLRAELAELVTS